MSAPENDLPIVVHEFQRNARGERIRIALDIFNGRPTFSIRPYYQGADGSWRPGKGGVNLTIRHLATMQDGLADAYRRAREIGWLDAEDAG